MIDSRYLVVDRPLWEGRQRLYRFENNFGASVVRHNGSYGGKEGLWELAVIKWSEESRDPGNAAWGIVHYTPITDDMNSPYHYEESRDPGNAAWGIVYDTPITDDVIGWLEESEIEPILLKIKSLNKYGQFDEE